MELLKHTLIQNILALDFMQLDNGTLPPTVSGSTLPPGSALPGPPRMTLAR